MITPTSGTALVGGFDVRTDIQKVRESLGLCPQHNVLFEELTVREHLYFFGKVSKIESCIAVRYVVSILIFLTLTGIVMWHYCFTWNINKFGETVLQHTNFPVKFFAVCGPYKILFIVKGVNLVLLQVHTQNSDPEAIYDLHLILKIVLQKLCHMCNCNITLFSNAFIDTQM